MVVEGDVRVPTNCVPVGRGFCYTDCTCMRQISTLMLLVLGLLPIAVGAEVFTNRPQTPYELLPMVADTGFGEYIGELRGYPVAYEFALATTTDVSFLLSQSRKVEEPLPLALLVVRSLPTGRVELVERVSPKDSQWEGRYERWLGMSWWSLPALALTLEPGSYRVEVSSPVNEGRYRLTVGEEEWESYGSMWTRVKVLNSFFGRTVGDWLESWFVLLHLVAAAVTYVLLRNVGWWWPLVVRFGQWFAWVCRGMYEYGRQRLSR